MKRARVASGCDFALFALSLCLPFSAAYAQTFVQPGDVVSISLPIQNAADSGDTINGVQVTLTGPSQATSITPSATVSIAPGVSQTLTASFTINPSAQSGSFTVNVITNINDVGIDPDPTTQNTSVTFDLVSLKVTDEQGDLIPDGSTTAVSIIYVDGSDGAAAISLTGPINFDPVTFAPGEAVAASFGTLEDGTYTAELLDSNGNVMAQTSFTVVQGSILNPLSPGQYTLEATNANGVTTVAPFQVVTMGVAVASANITFYDPDINNPNSVEQFQSGSVQMSFTSTLSISAVTVIDQHTGNVTEQQPTAPFNITGAEGLYLVVTDVDGNSYNAFGIPAPTGGNSQCTPSGPQEYRAGDRIGGADLRLRVRALRGARNHESVLLVDQVLDAAVAKRSRPPGVS